LDNSDPAYNLAVSYGDYDKAFRLVSGELHLTAEEERRFKIMPGFSRNHDDRHGQADPETLEVRLDPDLFIEGKEGACQGIIHELAHLRQFERDRRALGIYYSSHPVTATGWDGCEHETLSKPQKNEAVEEAYACLEDNELVPHAAAEDIEALLAQIPYAAGQRLREEDFSYLLEKLKRWSGHSSQVSLLSNQSYYPLEIRREDIRLFCLGTDYARSHLANPLPFQKAWASFCQIRP